MNFPVNVAGQLVRGTSGGATTLPRLPRARGMVAIRARLRDGRSVIANLRQEGSAKAFFPSNRGPMLEAVLLNTAGGIAGGDEFEYSGEAGRGASLGLTTQAAERAYRTRTGETGRVTVRLSVAAGGRIDWLPQETILFDRSALARRLVVDLAGDATLLAVEPLVFGRLAMDEHITAFRFSDQWRIRRDGRLIYADALRFSGSAELLSRPAVLGGAGAMASVLLASHGADAMLEPVRRLIPKDAGASVVQPGVLVVRMLAADGFDLRCRLIPVLETLRQAPLPSMWKM